MSDQPTSSWPMPLRIASLVAIVGVSGWLVWQTQQQSTAPAPAAPSRVAVPPPPPSKPLAAPAPAAAGAPAEATPVAAPALAPVEAPPEPAEAVAAEAPPAPVVAPGGNADPTFFHSSKAMVISAETLVLPTEAPPTAEVIGRNPVFLHSSKAMMPSTLPSLAAPDAGSAADTPPVPAEPVFIPSSKFADPALFKKVMDEEDVQAPPQQR
jgi:hypothetical protein